MNSSAFSGQTGGILYSILYPLLSWLLGCSELSGILVLGKYPLGCLIYFPCILQGVEPLLLFPESGKLAHSL